MNGHIFIILQRDTTFVNRKLRPLVFEHLSEMAVSLMANSYTFKGANSYKGSPISCEHIFMFELCPFFYINIFNSDLGDLQTCSHGTDIVTAKEVIWKA